MKHSFFTPRFLARHLASWALSGLVLVGSADFAHAGDAETPAATDSAAASLYFGNGVELLQTTPPNYQDAYNQFLLAYEKSGHSWKVTGNLGLCALNLERDSEALLYYRKYLDEGGAEVAADERASIEKELLLVEGNLAKVNVTSVAAEVTVTIRREGSSAPAQSYELVDGKLSLGLRAGSQSIVAESGGKKLVWELVLKPGKEASYTFDFAEPEVVAAPAAATAASPAEQAPAQGMTTLQTTGLVTAGVGVVALGGGIVTGILSNGKEEDARAQCNADDVCPESAEADFDSAKSMAMVSNILFVGGGVLVAGGLTMFLVGGPDKGSDSASLQLSPAPLWGGGGFVASGQF